MDNLFALEHNLQTYYEQHHSELSEKQNEYFDNILKYLTNAINKIIDRLPKETTHEGMDIETIPPYWSIVLHDRERRSQQTAN